MRLPRFRYAALAGLIMGCIVPVVLMIGFYFHVLRPGAWLPLMWPTSLMLMATENLGYSPEALGIIAMSIGYNLVLYLLLFSLL